MRPHNPITEVTYIVISKTFEFSAVFMSPLFTAKSLLSPPRIGSPQMIHRVFSSASAAIFPFKQFLLASFVFIGSLFDCISVFWFFYLFFSLKLILEGFVARISPLSLRIFPEAMFPSGLVHLAAPYFLTGCECQ
jgi:hypothetical protein